MAISKEWNKPINIEFGNKHFNNWLPDDYEPSQSHSYRGLDAIDPMTIEAKYDPNLHEELFRVGEKIKVEESFFTVTSIETTYVTLGRTPICQLWWLLFAILSICLLGLIL